MPRSEGVKRKSKANRKEDEGWLSAVETSHTQTRIIQGISDYFYEGIILADKQLFRIKVQGSPGEILSLFTRGKRTFNIKICAKMVSIIKKNPGLDIFTQSLEFLQIVSAESEQAMREHIQYIA